MYSLSASFEPSAPLDGDELARRVALEGEEEQAGVELAEPVVEAVGERVAAAQDLRAAVGRGRGEADVGVGGMRRAVGASSRSRTSLALAAERRARGLVAADRLLLVGQRGAVPDLDEHADAAGDEVGAAAHPRRPSRGAGPRRAGPARAASSALRLFVPSLKPIRLRGVACARLVDDGAPEAELRPAHASPTPRPMRARLRTAWKATCGSSAHACTQRSPPLRAGSSSSPGSAGRSRSGCRPLVGAARSASSNSDGPEAEGDRQPRRRQAERLAGVLRAAPSASPLAPPTGAPGRHPRGGAGPVAQQLAQVAARTPSSTSKAAKCSRSCAGVAMPAWWRRGRRRSGRARRAPRRTRRRGRGRTPPPAAAARPPTPRDAEQRAARRARHRSRPTSARAGACESGSASASIDLRERGAPGACASVGVGHEAVARRVRSQRARRPGRSAARSRSPARGPCRPAPGGSRRTPRCAPSTLAWKSSRSMCE